MVNNLNPCARITIQHKLAMGEGYYITKVKSIDTAMRAESNERILEN